MWNDKETNVDLLGHEKIAQTVIEIISENHLRPLTIGIYGDWGVGKSSILSILHEKAIGEKAAKISNSHVIVFNGWLFQGYEDVKTALMEKVILELAKLQPSDEKVKKLAKSLLGRVNWLKVAKLSVGAALTAVSGIPMGSFFTKAVDKAKDLAKPGEDEKLLNDEDIEDTVTNQIESFRDEFKQLIESSKVEHVIVVVDDLDRCLPKSVIEILEAIRLFLFVEGTTFVIAADEQMIEYAVREHFPNLPAVYADYTKSYLEKLIQIPIRIPTLNRFQTGNYIRFLMLQNYLKNDIDKLKQVYQLWEKKKDKPYDPLDLSYEIINQALDTEDAQLKETLMVAGQITPTLSVGLKGNPRNIKRFLNTLFLRLKIGRIYGLDSVIKLEVLSKLMLLERFQPELFNRIVDEVAISATGISVSIGKVEDFLKETSDSKPKQDTDPFKSEIFLEWASLLPPLKDVDLRPYIYISKEKALGLVLDTSVTEELVDLLEKLSSGNALGLRQAERELERIDKQKHLLLFEKLEASFKAATDLSRTPASYQGILRIIKVNPELEERALRLLESFPESAFGLWVVSEFSGLQSANGKAKFQQLLQRWAQQTENSQLKTFAAQTQKRKP
jgi:predicted KAP-like P-loop ATPase